MRVFLAMRLLLVTGCDITGARGVLGFGDPRARAGLQSALEQGLGSPACPASRWTSVGLHCLSKRGAWHCRSSQCGVLEETLYRKISYFYESHEF